ncbi:hypothetical protein FNV43_RR25057 [Rhamnella rubrinervis]|uniref:SMP-LTD domain-containing protein n=1 Tax=Rhamnella rubrinervis TaxID=2594499 RepID=A0A8K0DTT7_9ROSA|nr:hypothetical protein FNV43_RR25057 [Rhamnella rubrinervis]
MCISELAILMDLITRPIHELDACSLQDLMPEMPLWLKNLIMRVNWLNKVLSEMWPYLDEAAEDIIKGTAKPIFAEYIGKSIEFVSLSLGTLRPVICGLKVYDTNEKEIVLETAIRWAGNPNIVLLIKLFSTNYSSGQKSLIDEFITNEFVVLSLYKLDHCVLKIDSLCFQLVDLQIHAALRISLKPLVPTFPCFTNVVVSLMEKPDVDFGMKILGGDIMSVPGLYRYVQETIKSQVAILYHWPQTLEIPKLDAST